MADTVWLIEHEDGLRRSWLRESDQSKVEAIRLQLESDWRPGVVTARSMDARDVDRVAVDVHRHEAAVRGIDPQIIHRAVP